MKAAFIHSLWSNKSRSSWSTVLWTSTWPKCLAKILTIGNKIVLLSGNDKKANPNSPNFSRIETFCYHLELAIIRVHFFLGSSHKWKRSNESNTRDWQERVIPKDFQSLQSAERLWMIEALVEIGIHKSIEYCKDKNQIHTEEFCGKMLQNICENLPCPTKMSRIDGYRRQ